jgi:8-oxo-dGTP pyrophosphatase MutT (NUDIX family)
MRQIARGFDIQLLSRRLRGPKPGLASQLRMAPDPRSGQKTYQEAEGTCLQAGVLILLYPRHNRLSMVLTRRTPEVAHHQAQISFPGGQQNQGESVVDAALREAREELGIAAESVEIIGQLTPLYVPPSNFCIYPVLASAARRPDFRPAPREVAEVIEVPVDHLLNPKNIRREIWEIQGAAVTVPYFLFRRHKIWGATAMVLAEFLDLLREAS